MDTHWNKKLKALGPVVDRAARGFFIAALLVLTFGPMPLLKGNAPTASADDLGWSAVAGITNSGAALAYTHVSAASDTDIYAAASGGTAVMRSVDGGKSWAAVTAAPAALVGLRASKKYADDSSVLALTTTGVCLSTNKGGSWSCTSVAANVTGGVALVADGAGPVLATLTAFDMASNFSGIDGGDVVVGGVCTATNCTSRVRWLGTTQLWAGDEQINAAFDGDATNEFLPIAETAITNAGGVVLDLRFSPKFSSDSTVIRVVLSDAGAAGAAGNEIQENRISGLTGAWTTTAAGAGGQAFQTCAEVPAAQGATIAFPTDVADGATNFLVGIAGCVVTAATNDVWKRSGTIGGGTLTDLDVAGIATNSNVSGVVINGTFDSGTIVAVTNAASPSTYRSSNGGTSWKAVVNLDKDGGAIGAGNVKLDRAPGGTIFGAAAGVKGGIVWSGNSGSSWTDTSLNNENYPADILQFRAAPDGKTAFTLNSDTGANRSVYKTSNLDSGSSATWTRADRRNGINQMSMSPSFNLDGTVWIADTTTTSSQIYRSTDGGITFKVTTSDPGDKSLTSLTAISSTIALAGNNQGFVWWTTDGGATWTKSGTDLGDNVNSIVASSNFSTDNTLLASATGSNGNLEVNISTNGGTSFSQVGNSQATNAWGAGTTNILTTAATMSMAFAADYATSAIIFASPDTAGDSLYRYKVGATDAAWIKAVIPAAATAGFSNIVMSPNGVYATTGAAVGSFYGHYTPNTFSTTSSASFRTVPTAVPGGGLPQRHNTLNVASSASGNRVYLAGVVAGVDVIQTWTDTSAFLTPPGLTYPTDGASVTSNNTQTGSPINITWGTVTRAASYRVTVALDSKFDSTICDSNTPSGCGFAANPTSGAHAIPTGILADGATYYIRVRVQTVTGAVPAYFGGYSPVTRFTVGASATTSTPQPSLPLDGSQLPGLSSQLSWNNPPGTAQVQAQVTPLNGDGPAINLILGSPASTYDVPAPVFGTGPYVILPGASYTWRVRTTNVTIAVTETDQSWGPWSTPRTFTTAPPNSGTIQLLGPINGEATTDTTPTVQWKDANAAMFYYEIQLSADPNFGAQGAVASVFWNLIHGGQANPPDSWTVPDSVALAKGTYSWRVRQRLQATPKGSVETGIAWSPSQSFTVK